VELLACPVNTLNKQSPGIPHHCFNQHWNHTNA